MGLIAGEAIGLCVAPHEGQNFGLGLHRAQVAQRGGFAVSMVVDFDVVEGVDTHLSFVGQNPIAHRGGFVAAEERFHRGHACPG